MTTRFRQVADEITVTAPALPPGFFDRARRTRRVRNALTACAATLLVALAGLALITTPAPRPPEIAADPQRFPLPSELIEIPAWLADVRDAPIGQALIVTDLGDRLVLVSPDNSFRDLPVGRVEHTFLLSPDGGRLAMTEADRSYLLDLTSGAQRDLPGKAITWSSDGKQLAVRIDGGFSVLEADTLALSWAVTRPTSANCPEVDGIFSPDSSRFALVCSRDVDIYDRSGTSTRQTLPGAFRFAGPRAWSPLNSEIMFEQGSSNHVLHLDWQTGICREEDLYQRWRSPVPISPYIVDWWQGSPVFSDGSDFIPAVPAPHEVLHLITGYSAQAATAIVDWSHTRPPAEPDRGPWLLTLHQIWDNKFRLACMVLPVLLVVVLVTGSVQGRRRRERAIGS
ncbi:hypothetical protein Rhe02_00530 [Rhizocola hellebori]|uniref:Uncharacterized protein n=1 Tax=Rhizocola hellebori TaxID=1392758 RepID=A0A8J3Q249_9ACTN|nr:hypothetical protein [Rhizocola hellebori]GIH01986.1 hypothetical protein Rhe02_00530 [Rhizocola hellebori]